MGLLDDEYANYPNDLGSSVKRQDLFDVLNNVQIAGQIGKMNNGPLNLTTYGGRVGYGIPVGNGFLSAGIVGGGASGDYAGEKIRSRQVQGGDIGYSSGNDRFSISHDRMGNLQDDGFNTLRSESQDEQLGNLMALRNLTMLKWNRQF